MATKKAKKETAEKEVKEVKATKKAKKELTPEQKAEKKAKLKERLANRPEGQRPNSKQIDIIEAGKGKVLLFAQPVRKVGSLITSVALDAEGNVTGTSVTMIKGVAPKSKKGHGSLVPKVPGMKKGAESEVEEDDNEEENED